MRWLKMSKVVYEAKSERYIVERLDFGASMLGNWLPVGGFGDLEAAIQEADMLKVEFPADRYRVVDTEG